MVYTVLFFYLPMRWHWLRVLIMFELHFANPSDSTNGVEMTDPLILRHHDRQAQAYVDCLYHSHCARFTNMFTLLAATKRYDNFYNFTFEWGTEQHFLNSHRFLDAEEFADIPLVLQPTHLCQRHTYGKGFLLRWTFSDIE